jgi:hypothetical protein
VTTPTPGTRGGVQELSVAQTLGSEQGMTVLVVRPPRGPGELCCDGIAMFNRRPASCSVSSLSKGRIRLGQRLRDSVSGLEVVCTYAGNGALSFDGRPLKVVPNKPTPGCSRARAIQPVIG